MNNSQFSNPTPDHMVRFKLCSPSPVADILDLVYSQRTLVLDYLCHNCYSDSARAFARDSQVQHLDRDGDDLTLSSASGSDNTRNLSNELLRLVELRQRKSHSIFVSKH